MTSIRNLFGVSSLFIFKAGIVFLAILLVTIAAILASVLLQGNVSSIASDPIRWFSNLEPDIAFDIVSTSAELLAAVLAIAITVVAIIVELAANRYSHRITSLFVHEPVNILVMSFFVLATVYSVWIALTLDASVVDAQITNAGLLGSLVMVSIALIILLPYFAFVMTFLSPVSVINKIQKTAMNSVTNITPTSIPASQFNFLNAVDELQDIARRSAESNDRAVEMASIDAMLGLILQYQTKVAEIAEKNEEWFKISDVLRRDPDFVSVNEASLDNVQSNRLWVEVKILRQYLDLMSTSGPGSRDASYLIAINTKNIAVSSASHRPELELTQLCMRCFNSYLRTTINNKDARTGYYVLNQYRQLAEQLLTMEEPETAESIALYIQFYGLLGFRQGMPFLLEVAAEDIAHLAGLSIDKNEQLLDTLLTLLLDLDQEVREESQEESLLGVRRAQLKLATQLMASGDEIRASRICDDLKLESESRKRQLFDLLESEDRTEYWEFTDRGVNFAYLSPDLKIHLADLAKKTL